MKKILTLFFTTLLLTASVFAIEVENEDYYAKFRNKNITINVFNWGEYISDTY